MDSEKLMRICMSDILDRFSLMEYLTQLLIYVVASKRLFGLSLQTQEEPQLSMILQTVQWYMHLILKVLKLVE